MKVGFVGTGKMGRPMAERLLAAGHELVAFNRSRPSLERLASQGATIADQVTDVAAGSDVVLTALPSTESVEEVYSKLVDAARPGQIFADHSTVPLRVNRWCGARLAERGTAFLDAPVSGGPAGAEAGTLTVMVGGTQAAFEGALPVFQCYGQVIRLCGPLGSGQTIKLVNQLLVGIHTAALSEAAVFAAGLGADARVVLEMIGPSFGGSTMLSRNLPRVIARDFTPATPVSILVKDMGLIHDEARNAGAPIPLGAWVEQRFVEAQSRGLGDDDMAALVRLWEEAASIVVGEDSLPRQDRPSR